MSELLCFYLLARVFCVAKDRVCAFSTKRVRTPLSKEDQETIREIEAEADARHEAFRQKELDFVRADRELFGS